MIGLAAEALIYFIQSLSNLLGNIVASCFLHLLWDALLSCQLELKVGRGIFLSSLINSYLTDNCSILKNIMAKIRLSYCDYIIGSGSCNNFLVKLT